MPTENFNSKSETTGSDVAMEKTRELTFGEKLVGIKFNPSSDSKVDMAKRLCAELADLLFIDDQQSERSPMKDLLLPHAYQSILDAQMNAVKVLTLKY